MMRINVKTVAGTRFKIETKRDDIVADVKKNIETVQGPNVYPAAQQVLLHHGKILKDETTLEENNITENSFMFILLRKTKSSASRSSTTSDAPANVAQPANSIAPSTQPSPASHFVCSEPATESIHVSVSVPVISPSSAVTNLHRQAESCKAVGTDVESNIQHLLYLGKGNWDRETVTHALHATSNNRRKAVQYILFGDLEEDEIPPEDRTPVPVFAFAYQPVAASGGPNASPLDLFPQRASNVDSEARARIIQSWRNSECFQAFRTTVQANPRRLLPMLQDLSKVNRGLLRVIQENLIDFVRLLNEPVEREGNVPRKLAESMVTESMSRTREENEAIEHGIPDEAAMSPVAQVAPQPAAASGGPNTNPLDLCPQGLQNVDSNARAHIMDFLRNDQDFQAVRTMLQAYPEILQERA
ncbi:Heat shock chaperonin-binding [Artemisia annua]|uniref:Heat shock chaperonin-binding n=1 Tax=Artemisia annua TaxID=35608 RepID=A0A2U1MY32_ARTAN|nr:Heat shock chaperonin-binding [Artemisia annua]